MGKKLITPTEESAAFLRGAQARATKHKAASEESARYAKQALRQGDYDEVLRRTAHAAEERASYYAAEAMLERWRLPEPTHYIPPDARGGLPAQDSKAYRSICRSRVRRSVTCRAESTTCPACIKLLLLKQIDAAKDAPRP